MAIFTSGGPPRYTVACPRTNTVYSLIPGMYAPPAVELPKTSEIVGIPAADRRVISRKVRPPGTNRSAWRGRSAPPDSTRAITGSRLRSAISSARSCLVTPIGVSDPPFTVGSLATSTQSTPLTGPIPQISPAPGVVRSGSCAPASAATSRNGASGSRSRSTRSRAVSLPRSWWRSTYCVPPAASTVSTTVSRAPRASSMAARSAT